MTLEAANQTFMNVTPLANFPVAINILYQFVIVQPHSHSLCGALEIGRMKGQVLPSYYIFLFQAFSNLKARKVKYSKEVPIKTEINNFQFGDLKKQNEKMKKRFLLLFPPKTTF